MEAFPMGSAYGVFRHSEAPLQGHYPWKNAYGTGPVRPALRVSRGRSPRLHTPSPLPDEANSPPW